MGHPPADAQNNIPPGAHPKKGGKEDVEQRKTKSGGAIDMERNVGKGMGRKDHERDQKSDVHSRIRNLVDIRHSHSCNHW